jgi:hypothetical protein
MYQSSDDANRCHHAADAVGNVCLWSVRGGTRVAGLESGRLLCKFINTSAVISAVPMPEPTVHRVPFKRVTLAVNRSHSSEDVPDGVDSHAPSGAGVTGRRSHHSPIRGNDDNSVSPVHRLHRDDSIRGHGSAADVADDQSLDTHRRRATVVSAAHAGSEQPVAVTVS